MIIIQPGQALAIQWIFVILSFLFTSLRLYVRIYYFCSFAIADGLVVFAWCCLTANHAMNNYFNAWGFWNQGINFGRTLPDINTYIRDRDLIVRGLIMLYVNGFNYYAGLYAIKAAFLILYFKIFPPGLRKLRISLYVVSVAVAIGYIGSAVLNLFACQPVARNWSPNPGDRCLASSILNVYLFTNGFHLISDIVIYVLPFFLLPTLLKRATRRDIGVIVTIFSLGFLCVLTSLIRIVLVGDKTLLALICALGAGDLGMGICVVCCPVIKSGLELRWHEQASRATPMHTPEKRSLSDKLKGIFSGNKPRTEPDMELQPATFGLSTTVMDRTGAVYTFDARDELESGVGHGFGPNKVAATPLAPRGGNQRRAERIENIRSPTESLHLPIQSNTPRMTTEELRLYIMNKALPPLPLTIPPKAAVPVSKPKGKRPKGRNMGMGTFGGNSTFASTGNRSVAASQVSRAESGYESLS